MFIFVNADFANLKVWENGISDGKLLRFILSDLILEKKESNMRGFDKNGKLIIEKQKRSKKAKKQAKKT